MIVGIDHIEANGDGTFSVWFFNNEHGLGKVTAPYVLHADVLASERKFMDMLHLGVTDFDPGRVAQSWRDCALPIFAHTGQPPTADDKNAGT
jgi:hypothetical protein